MTDPDTAPVQITVSPLVPVSGKGDVKFLASVTLDIGGVVLVLDGWTLRQDKAGGMRPFLPAYRDPRTGAWAACVEPEFAVHRHGDNNTLIWNAFLRRKLAS